MLAAPALPSCDPALVDAVLDLIRRRRSDMDLFVLGLCGAQGSGKSTLARSIIGALESMGIPAAALSLDDIYLTRFEREVVGQHVHPLLVTRGVPGTHDIGLGMAVLDALGRGEAVALPRFAKGADDRASPEEWPLAQAGCRVLVFEGWCVGARPQAVSALEQPVNQLERAEDPNGRWRRHANDCLAGAYQQLFARIDALVMLAAPSFDVVARWRLQQEADLPPGGTKMDAAAIGRFVQFYERLTLHMLSEMPERADLVASLDESRRLISLVSKT